MYDFLKSMMPFQKKRLLDKIEFSRPLRNDDDVWTPTERNLSFDSVVADFHAGEYAEDCKRFYEDGAWVVIFHSQCGYEKHYLTEEFMEAA